MKFEVIKPGSAGEMKEISAIDCKSYNKIEEAKRAVFEEIRNEKGQDEAAKAEQEFYDAFLPGGKYKGRPERWKGALIDIRERHFPRRRLDIKSLVKELQTLEKETAHEM